MSTTLPLFWHLSSAAKKERIDASVKLVGALEQFQLQFVPKDVTMAEVGGQDEDEDEDGDGDDGQVKAVSDGLESLNSQDVAYSIRRLIRGLASPRESSRLGFAVALTELLSRINTVTCSQILALLLSGTKPQGSTTGQEERDVLFARLFGFTSIIQSGLLVRVAPLPTSTSSSAQPSDLASYESVINHLVALGEKKSWLRESAWWTISLAFNTLHKSIVAWKEEAVDATLRILFVENKVWSPEKVALTLISQAEYSGKDWRTFLIPPFKTADLFSSANLQILARILKESAADDESSKDTQNAPAGTWKPQLHFVWDVILDRLLPTNGTAKGSFQEFFRVAVDESLFSSNSSAERKYWGFQVFQKALPRVTQETMPMLFTKNFMRSWINHLSHPDRYLHKIARQAATEVQAFVQKNPQLGFALILQLTGVHGSRQFDKITKTKTIENILATMNADQIKDYIEYLLKQIDEADGEESGTESQAINSRRMWVLEQFGSLIRNGSIPKSDDWVEMILDWLVVHGLFLIKKKATKSPYRALHAIPEPPFSEDLRSNCCNRLLSCLSDLNSQTTVIKTGDKTVKVPAVASDGEFWIAKVLNTIGQLEADSKHVTLLAEVEEDEVLIRKKARDEASRLAQISGDQSEAAQGAQLLLLATMLQRYCADQDVDAEVLETSTDAAVRMFPAGEQKKSHKTPAKSVVEDAAEPVDVFVDTIIGFLEKSTAYMRTVGNQVFSLISGSVKDSTIDLIVAQLERRNPSELLQNGDEDDEGEDASEREDESESGSEEDDDEGEKDESEEESGDEEVDLELRSKIEAALRANGIQAASDNSENEDDEEEELMDDDQMLAIDEQIAAVFRSQTNERKSGKAVDAQREATHFKNRVLDLVDTYVKKQPSSPHILRLIPPLIELIAGTGQDERQLADKAKGILRSRIGKSKEVLSGVTAQAILAVITDIHLRARKVHSSDMLATLSQCSIYLSRSLIQLDEEALVELYRQSLVDFLTRKNSALNTGFFQDILRRYPSTGWQLRHDLLELSKKAVNVYRQCQALQLLEILVSQIPALGDRKVEVTGLMTALRKHLLEVATNACQETVVFTTPQMKDILKLALLGVRQTQRAASKSPGEVWSPADWSTLSAAFQSSSRFGSSPALPKMCDQVVRSCQPPAEAPIKENSKSKSKRKVSDSSAAEVEAPVAKKAKRKKLKEWLG